MIYSINETHDLGLRSWVESANDPATDFPIQNLPLGVFTPRIRRARRGKPHIGVAIGDSILDLYECARHELFSSLDAGIVGACRNRSLNKLMSLGHQHWSALRRRVSQLLNADCHEIQSNKELANQVLVPMRAARMLLPARVGDYTDFYASVFHATNVGSMFRPDNPLFPNYKYVPIGYHGRASSLVVSGARIRRPRGQTNSDDATAPVFGPSRSLDYELEIGFFVGPGNKLGETIAIADAEKHVFGVCLLNDWSARDVQKWEYQPLGPFLAKSFATTMSPWIVTMEALAPYRVPAFNRPDGDPEPLPYLHSPDDQQHGGIDVTVEAQLSTPLMREQGIAPARLSRGTFQDMYWTIAQLLTHHASNGCNLRASDLLASGTVSGPARESRGCLLELTWRGKEPIQLPTGETRRFLQDGDEVMIRGYCTRDGFARIGLGECSGVVLPVNE
jgi:fumarylacetoacetase